MPENIIELLPDPEDILDQLIEVKVNTDKEGYYFDLSGNDYPTFEVVEGDAKYCIGCIVPLDIDDPR